MMRRAGPGSGDGVNGAGDLAGLERDRRQGDGQREDDGDDAPREHQGQYSGMPGPPMAAGAPVYATGCAAIASSCAR
jgi:hypothetical protein